MSLKLVKSEAVSTFDPGEISPYLQDAAVRYQVLPEDGTHQFDFDTEFDGRMLAGALALEATVVSDSTGGELSKERVFRGIKSGLRTLTYPNSRIMRNAKYVDRDARSNLLNARPDITGLITAIDHPEHHQMVPAKLTLYSELTADIAIDAALQELKPQALRNMCDTYGVSLDDIALRRLKGRRRDTYVDADKFVDDAKKLKAQYRLDKFKRAVILPDEEETVLTDADDWPKDGWSEKADAIQLLHMLPEISSDTLGARWRVLIRDDSSARHVVRPRLLIRSEAAERRETVANHPHESHIWTRPETYLLFDAQPPTYDRTTHTVVHTSAALGAVLLMQNIDQELLNTTLQAALFGKDFRPWRRTTIPDKALGLAPMVVQKPAVQSHLLSNSGLKHLVEHLEADLAL